MKVVLIDDESKARDVLKLIIQEHCPAIKEISLAKNLIDGVAVIRSVEPDIIFLDIEMPQHSGLEIADFLSKEEMSFEIIFTTAYSEYAIQAFQLSAIDYLLKPIRPALVKQAVTKALERRGNDKINSRLEELRESLLNNNFNKIALPVANGIKFINFDSILMFEASGMYTNVISKDEGEILISKPLKHFSEILDSMKTFYKPHRSYIINLKYIKQYVKSDGGYIIMDNDKTVSISKEKKEEFLRLVNTF